MLKERFLEAGGVVMERTSFRSAECGKDGVLVRCAAPLPQTEHPA